MHQLTPFTSYDFELHSQVHTSGTHVNNGMVSEYKTKFSLQTGKTGCEVELRVESTDQSAEIDDTPLRFALQDGLVDEICPSYEETKESLNFKRAILSQENSEI